MTTIYSFLGTADSEIIRGSIFNDFISGLGGNDLLFSGPGKDTVHGGDGGDTIYNDRGNDVLYGDAGRDTISFEYIDVYSNSSLASKHNTTSVTFDLAKTTQTVANFGTDTYSGFENVAGGDGQDYLYGNSSGNFIDGGSGNDALSGRGGNDTVMGSLGNDIIVGGDGADVLAGFQPNANSSGQGHDNYVYRSISESGTTSTTRDTIWGHFYPEAAGSDKIDLSLIDANPDVAGNQGFHFIGGKEFSSGQMGEVRVTHTTGDEYLVAVDTDHDNGAEMTILVHSTAHALTASDFYL